MDLQLNLDSTTLPASYVNFDTLLNLYQPQFGIWKVG